jgi:hypothetical protein
MIKIIRQESLTELEQDGSWSLNPPFSEDSQEFRFNSINEAMKWINEQIKQEDVGLNISDLSECNGNDLQVNFDKKVMNYDNHKMELVGCTLIFWFYEEKPINIKDLGL